jgi:uncharacterized RDD family membrane protein YckC
MKEHKYLPADFNDRINAFGFDYAIVFLILLIAIFMQIHPIYDTPIKMGIALVGWYFVNVFPHHFYPGLTFGKKKADIIILTKDYEKVSVKRMYARQFFILIMSILTAGIFVIVSFIIIESRNDKRAIHDLIFQTRVVKRTPYVGDGFQGGFVNKFQ